MLAVMYKHGMEGFPKDPEQGFYWFSKAAEQGDALAQRGIGLCYQYGNGVGKDTEKAFAAYEKAVEMGDEES